MAFAGMMIVGGGIWALTKNGSGTPGTTPTSMVSPTEGSSTVDVTSPTEAIPNQEVTEQHTAISSTVDEWDGWRVLDLMIPNPQVWKTTGENTYTALGPSDYDSFA